MMGVADRWRADVRTARNTAAFQCSAPFIPKQIAADSMEALEAKLDAALAAGAAALVSSGGVSMGDRDLIKANSGCARQSLAGGKVGLAIDGDFSAPCCPPSPFPRAAAPAGAARLRALWAGADEAGQAPHLRHRAAAWRRPRLAAAPRVWASRQSRQQARHISGAASGAFFWVTRFKPLLALAWGPPHSSLPPSAPQKIQPKYPPAVSAWCASTSWSCLRCGG